MDTGSFFLGSLTWLVGDLSWQNAMDWLRTILIAGGLALLIRWAIGEPYKIPSQSMYPTLHGKPGLFQGDRVFVNKLYYGLRWPFNDTYIPFTKIHIHYANDRIFRWHKPKRWDIVVFKSVEKDARHNTLVKRIVALPGEHVHIGEDGEIYINGKKVERLPSMPKTPYTQMGMGYGVLHAPHYSVVPEDHYLLLGDNSPNSRDGRFWGWVPNEHILGPVTCVWWPPSHWSDFTGFSRTWWWRLSVGLLSILLFWRLFLGRSLNVRDPLPDTALKPRDHVYIHTAAFGIPIPFTRRRLTRGRPPVRGELVAFRVDSREAGDAERLVLARVAALPGDTVHLDDGRLQVDGTPADFGPFAERRYPSREGDGPWGRSKKREYSTVPDGFCFLLNEASGPECDSRTLGWIPMENLVGPVSLVWWGPRRWRRIY